MASRTALPPNNRSQARATGIFARGVGKLTTEQSMGLEHDGT
jgi:hypothetical protein